MIGEQSALHWMFFKDDNEAWQWSFCTLSDARTHTSRLRFPTLLACIADASVHGYSTQCSGADESVAMDAA
jgi:hypothetical protein